MSPTSDITQWPGRGPGKGFLARTESGEFAVEVWKTDQAGVPMHAEGLVAFEYTEDVVVTYFAIYEGRLNVFQDDDLKSAYRLIVELDPRLGDLELQKGWDFGG